MRNTKGIQKMLFIAFLLLALVLPASWAAEENSKPGAVKQYVIEIPVFQSELELKDWIRSRLGTAQVVEIERDGRRACVALESVGSGRITTVIYIFIRNAESDNWGIAAIWQTYTSEVKVVVPKRGKVVTFKSKSGKTLFRVPLETLEPKNDPNY